MPMQVNLLPTEFRPKPPVRFWPVAIAVALILNLLFISGYWLILQFEMSSTRSIIKTVESEIDTTQCNIDELQWKADLKANLERKQKFIDDEITGSVLWSPALTVIEKSLFPGVKRISNLSFSGNGSISLTAEVESIKNAVDYWASIQTRTGLEGIWLSSAPEGGSISLSMTGWYGREAIGDEE